MIDLQEREISSTKLLGGRACLDFVNTLGGRKERKGIEAYVIRAEKLKDYADLLAWGLRTQLLTESEAQRLLRESLRNPAGANAVWKRAFALREAIYKIALSALQNKQPKPSDLEIFNRELSHAHARLKL